jgi:hypothetical protein
VEVIVWLWLVLSIEIRCDTNYKLYYKKWSTEVFFWFDYFQPWVYTMKPTMENDGFGGIENNNWSFHVL